MKAIVLEEIGEAQNLKMADVARPQIRPHEVLIRNQAISINPVDYKVRANEELLNLIYGEQRPAILGWDIAGDVIALGEGVSDLKVGDRVFGMINFIGAGNGYAEFVVAPATHLAVIPDALSYEAAAASTLAALTALQVLAPNVRKGDKVLIHAGSGGVGHFAIQIAKALGAFVVSTSSGSNKDFVLSLGADEHIDYRREKFEEVLSEMDFVYDMFNGDILHNSIKVVKNGGKIVSIPSANFSEETLQFAKEKGVEIANHMVYSSGEDMYKIKEMLESGALRPHVSKTYRFDEMVAAHEHLESGRTVGKVVVAVD
ncbi:MAG: NADP-dependent oxidoreductase [Bacteroidota bacterium]